MPKYNYKEIVHKNFIGSLEKCSQLIDVNTPDNFQQISASKLQGMFRTNS